MNTTFDLITRYCNVLKDLFSREGLQFDRITDIRSIQLFEESIILSERIIRRYHLPTTAYNLDLLPWQEVYLMGEDEIHQLMARLQKEYESYLSEYLRPDVSYLEEAVSYGYRCEDVLDDLSISKHSYTEFIYNQILLKSADTTQNVLNEMRKVSQDPNILKNVALAGYSSGEARHFMLNRLDRFDLNYISEYLDFTDSVQYNSLKESIMPVYISKDTALFVDKTDFETGEITLNCVLVDFANQTISSPMPLLEELKKENWYTMKTHEADLLYYRLMNEFSKNQIFENVLLAFNYIEETEKTVYPIMPLRKPDTLKPAA